MPTHRMTAAWLRASERPVPLVQPGTRADDLVGLVSRLMVAQGAASAAIGAGYGRRNLPWLVLTIAVAVAVCALAGLVRSGGHGTWLAAVMIESALVAIGVFLFAYARYLGGTLLAIITLGVLLHPAVSRAFSPGRVVTGSADLQPALADAATELQGSAASP